MSGSVRSLELYQEEQEPNTPRTVLTTNRPARQKASQLISKTFQTSQKLQRTIARPSSTTVQNKFNYRLFILLNTMDPHSADQRTIIEIMQYKASLVRPNAKTG